MPILRRTYAFAAVAATAFNLYARYTSPVSLSQLFFQGVKEPGNAVSVVQALGKFFRYDQLAAFSAGAIWTMLSFKDLKKAGKVSAGWGKIVGLFAGTTLIAGPGAAMTAMWAWREEALAKREKVIVREEKRVVVEEKK